MYNTFDSPSAEAEDEENRPPAAPAAATPRYVAAADAPETATCSERLARFVEWLQRLWKAEAKFADKARKIKAEKISRSSLEIAFLERHEFRKGHCKEEFPWYMFMLCFFICVCYGVVLSDASNTGDQFEAFGRATGSIMKMTSKLTSGIRQDWTRKLTPPKSWRDAADSLVDRALNCTKQLDELERSINKTMAYVSNETAIKNDAIKEAHQEVREKSLEAYQKAIKEAKANYTRLFQDLNASFQLVNDSITELGLQPGLKASIEKILFQVRTVAKPLVPLSETLAKYGGPNFTDMSVKLDNMSNLVNETYSKLPGQGDLLDAVDRMFNHTVYLASLVAMPDTEFAQQIISKNAQLYIEYARGNLTRATQAVKEVINKTLGAKVDVEDFFKHAQKDMDDFEDMLASTGDYSRRLFYTVSFYIRKAFFYFCGFAVLLASVCFGYILYLRFRWEHTEVEDAFQLEEEGIIQYGAFVCFDCCCGCCFWQNMCLADIISILMVFVTIVLVVIGAIKIGLDAGCKQPGCILADDDLCTAQLNNLHELLQVDFMREGTSRCGENDLLICSQTAFYRPLFAIITAVLGLVAICLLPRNMIAYRAFSLGSVDSMRIAANYEKTKLLAQSQTPTQASTQASPTSSARGGPASNDGRSTTAATRTEEYGRYGAASTSSRVQVPQGRLSEDENVKIARITSEQNKRAMANARAFSEARRSPSPPPAEADTNAKAAPMQSQAAQPTSIPKSTAKASAKARSSMSWPGRPPV